MYIVYMMCYIIASAEIGGKFSDINSMRLLSDALILNILELILLIIIQNDDVNIGKFKYI